MYTNNICSVNYIVLDFKEIEDIYSEYSFDQLSNELFIEYKNGTVIQLGVSRIQLEDVLNLYEIYKNSKIVKDKK